MTVINTKIAKGKSFNLKSFTVDLDFTKFDQMIEDQGVRVRVFKSLLCPNVKQIDGGEHEIDCTLCEEGFIDEDPKEGFAFLQSQSLHTDFSKEGRWDDSTVAATFLSSFELQYFSRIELLDFTTTFYERIQRQIGEIDRLKYKAHKINTLVDKDGVKYYEGTDLRLDPNGDIEWLTQNRPANKVIYSVHYDYPITFRAIEAIHINRFGQKSFKQDFKEPTQAPQQWKLKRDFLIDRKDLDSNPLTKNKIHNPYTDNEPLE